jgi:hypothetical protein
VYFLSFFILWITCTEAASHISSSAGSWSKTASDHRLNQPTSKKNQSLLMAAKVNEKKARLKEVHQGQLFTVELSMMLIDENAKHHKVSSKSELVSATNGNHSVNCLRSQTRLQQLTPLKLRWFNLLKR